jgi:tetratricopeptide (TPR) repeat protein
MVRSRLLSASLVGCFSTFTLPSLAQPSKPAAAKAAPQAAQPAPLASPELAQSDGGEDPARFAHAKALFEKGAAAYAAGRYYEAIELFLEVDRLYPSAQLSFNIAKAYDNLGSRPGALRSYREYLRRAPDAPDKDAITTRVHDLETALAERGIQQLSVTSDPEDALVLLDEKPVGLTPWTGETWPGRHRIVVQKAGFSDRELVMELDPLKAQNVTLELARAPINAPTAPPPVAKHAEPWPMTRKMSVLTWATLAAGTAALGTAIAVEVASGSKSSGISPATAFFAGIGTAATAVGGVMLYFDLSDQTSDDKHAGLRPRGMVAGYSGSF